MRRAASGECPFLCLSGRVGLLCAVNPAYESHTDTEADREQDGTVCDHM